jgi:hypothetical protein
MMHNRDNVLYPVKWGLPEETMRGQMKQGKAGRYTPFQMLEKYLQNGNPGPAYWGKLLKEYRDAMYRARQVTWSRSPNLRHVAGIGEEKPVEKIVEGEEAGYILLATLTDSQWAAIVSAGERGTILDCCAAGKVEMAMKIISDIEQDMLRRIDENTR